MNRLLREFIAMFLVMWIVTSSVTAQTPQPQTPREKPSPIRQSEPPRSPSTPIASETPFNTLARAYMDVVKVMMNIDYNGTSPAELEPAVKKWRETVRRMQPALEKDPELLKLVASSDEAIEQYHQKLAQAKAPQVAPPVTPAQPGQAIERPIPLAPAGGQVVPGPPTAPPPAPTTVAAAPQQTPQTTTAPTDQLPANPLVQEKKVDHTSVWELSIPKRPDDRNVKLTYGRMAYGLGLISGSPEEPAFIQKYGETVQPGDDAWEKAENLVIEFTQGKVLDANAQIPELTPENLTIVTTVEDMEKYFSLNPLDKKEFSEMNWQRDPVGKCVIKKRGDLMNNIQAIDAQIDRVYQNEPDQADRIKKAMHACAVQSEETDTCKTMKTKDIKFLLRNYGQNSVGKNESYLLGTNYPDAELMLYFVPEIGWKGQGFQCCGNHLDFFTHLDLKAFGTGLKTKTPENLTCSIAPTQYVFHSRADSITFNLTVTPPQKPEDTAIDWFRATTLAGRNTMQFGVSGADVEPNFWTPIEARVAVGKKEVRCDARVSLQFPPPPPPTPIPTPPPPPVQKTLTKCTNIEFSEYPPGKPLSHGQSVEARPELNPTYGKIHGVRWSADQRQFAQMDVANAVTAQTTVKPDYLKLEKGKPAVGQHLIRMDYLDEDNQPQFCSAEFPVEQPFWTKRKKIGAGVAGGVVAGVLICWALGCFSGGPGLHKNPVPTIGNGKAPFLEDDSQQDQNFKDKLFDNPGIIRQ